jgi:hypothetical protein
MTQQEIKTLKDIADISKADMLRAKLILDATPWDTRKGSKNTFYYKAEANYRFAEMQYKNALTDLAEAVKQRDALLAPKKPFSNKERFMDERAETLQDERSRYAVEQLEHLQYMER